MTVTATLAVPTNRLVIANVETASGVPRSVQVCQGVAKFTVVIYKASTEVGRYTVSIVDVPPPPPPAPVYYVTSLSAPGLSPAFNKKITSYTAPRTACSIPVSVTVSDPTLKIYVSSVQTTSGGTVRAWVCDGKTKVDVIVYQVWTEKARVTITMVDPPTPTPTPTLPYSHTDSDLGAKPGLVADTTAPDGTAASAHGC